MTLATAESPPPRSARAIVQRTRGRTQGSATRLMSPSDFGEILKPFVFLDLFDHEGAPFNAGLHPHSGIATLTYVADTGGWRAPLPCGSTSRSPMRCTARPSAWCTAPR